MSVIFTPSSFPQKKGKDIDLMISYLLRPQQIEKLPLTRRVDLHFTLLQPLSFHSFNLSSYNRNFIHFIVENSHFENVFIFDLKIHENFSHLLFFPSDINNNNNLNLIIIMIIIKVII